MISAIVAVDDENGIGKDGIIPWMGKKSNPITANDMKWFEYYTMKKKYVLMGRKTWNSLTHKLRNRYNMVLSRQSIPGADATFSSIMEFMHWWNNVGVDVVIMGGGEIYRQFILAGLLDEIWISKIPGKFNCDTFFDDKLDEYVNIENKFLGELKIFKYIPKPRPEKKLLEFIYKIATEGNFRIERTGVGAMSLFGFDIRLPIYGNRFPLLTTRRLPLRMIFEELMWILRGQTNTKILEAKNVGIWSGNSSRAFLDKMGLGWHEGDIGPSYGFLLRHYGEEYKGCDEEYKGFDQLAHLIKTIKSNPSDRRLILSLWDPSKISQMALPPCLYNYQFFIANGKLSCKATQRSSDILLAGGWNIATTALLTYLIAKTCDLEPYEIIWSVGDAHVYNNQINERLWDYLRREPRGNPLLYVINKKNITEYEYGDIQLLGYKPDKNFKIEFNA